MPILPANLFNRWCFASWPMEICFLPRIIRCCRTCHLFSIGVPKVGTGLGTILGAAELPTAIIASITLVHEVVTFMQWIGIIVILLGIFTPQLLTARKKRNIVACIVHNKRPFMHLKGLFLYLTLPLHITFLTHAQFVLHRFVQIVALHYQF